MPIVEGYLAGWLVVFADDDARLNFMPQPLSIITIFFCATHFRVAVEVRDWAGLTRRDGCGGLDGWMVVVCQKRAQRQPISELCEHLRQAKVQTKASVRRITNILSLAVCTCICGCLPAPRARPIYVMYKKLPWGDLHPLNTKSLVSLAFSVSEWLERGTMNLIHWTPDFVAAKRMMSKLNFIELNAIKSRPLLCG